MATERLIIEVTEKGTRRVSKEVDKVGKSAKAAGGNVQFLKRALTGLGVAAASREVIRLADSYTNLQNRLRLVTDTQQELIATTEGLFQVSNRTRTSVAANAELFNRLAQSTKELNISNEELLQITESLNQATIISGASAQEASAALIQLSQGLSAGALRGEELNSVLEQTPRVADVIAKQLGVTRGALRQLASEGKITSQVVLDGFKAAREELQNEFNKTVPTVSQSFVVLKNNVTEFIGELNTSTGITGTLGNAVLLLGENIERVARFSLGAALIPALLAARLAVVKLTAAIAANPLGLLLVGLSTAIGLLVAFKDELSFTADGASTFGDVFGVVFDNIRASAAAVTDFFRDTFGGALSFIGVEIENVGASVEGFFRLIARGFDTVTLLPRIFATSLALLFTNGFGAAAEAAVNGANSIIEAFNKVARFVSRIIRDIQTETNKAAANAAAAFGFEGVDLGIGGFAIGEIGLIKNEFEGAGQELGDALKRGVELSIADGPAEALLDGFVNQVELKTQERLAANENRRRLSAQTAPQAGAAAATGESSEALLNKQQIAINKVIDSLRREGEVLSKTGIERQIANDIRKQTETLTRQGIDLSKAENAQTLATITALVTKNATQERAAQILQDIRTPEEERQVRLQEIAMLQAAGALTQEQYNLALERYVENLNNSETAGQAFIKQLQRIDTTAQGLAAEFGAALVNSIGSASDALADFIVNGANDIDSLRQAMSDILKQLAKQILATIIQALILRALVGESGGAGGAGNPVGGLIGAFTQRQAGGPVTTGVPVIVGEKGPEMFVPTESGNVVPNSQIAQQPPQVNNQVVIVRDPDEIPNALEEESSQQIIINTMRENQEVIER